MTPDDFRDVPEVAMAIGTMAGWLEERTGLANVQFADACALIAKAFRVLLVTEQVAYGPCAWGDNSEAKEILKVADAFDPERCES